MARPSPATAPAIAVVAGDSSFAATFLSAICILVGATVLFGLVAHPRCRDDPAEVAYFNLCCLNYFLVVLSVCCFRLTPPGSAARRLAGIATWLLATSLLALLVWKAAARQPLPVAILFWVVAAASLGSRLRRFYLTHLRGQ